MMTCFQILSPLQSYSIFISSCLGSILASKHRFILSVHKGGTIIPVIFNYNLKFTYSERMADSIMCSLVLHLSNTPLLDFTLGTQCKFLPRLFKNDKLLCFFYVYVLCSGEDSNVKLLFFTGNTLHILWQPQAMAKRRSELLSTTAHSSVWLLNY